MRDSSIQTSKPCIILGVGGGIAAYKICDLASHLTQQNYDIHVVMTSSAQRFVAPLTFQALTQNPVHLALWPENNASENGLAASMAHIDLAVRANVILIAPATADLIAKLAHGLADDLLSTLILATRAPILIAPAMNPFMLEHPATQKNLQTLRTFGYQIIEPERGRMACEHVGAGRLPATGVLSAHLQEALKAKPKSQSLAGKKVLVTAGPTRENIDPVRFLSNRSSGKMGYAMAEEAASRGAEVMLVSGPTNLSTPDGVKCINVMSTQQMYDAVNQHAPDADFVIAAAAPADFAPIKISEHKIKKQDTSGVLQLNLAPTPDIIASAFHRLCRRNQF